ncbi:MAG: METTL5 family protein [archaeon]
MNKKQLEIALSKLEGFEEPVEGLEQYRTPGSVAADMLHTAYMQGDIAGKTVADLGCGTGVLAIGAVLLEAKKVYGVDIEPDAIELAVSNEKRALGERRIEWMLAPVDEFETKVDTVVQNPPFGIKERHADTVFLEAALKTAKVIYTIHDGNEDTRKFINNHVKSLGGAVSWVKRLDFELPRTLEHHRLELTRIPVDLYRVVSHETEKNR